VKELVYRSKEIAKILGTADLTQYMTGYKTLQSLLAANKYWDNALGFLSGMLISSSE
jgi:hypothetical protein